MNTAENRLTFLQDLGTRKRILHHGKQPHIFERYGLYQCACGKTTEAKAYAVKTGNTRSCGCLHIECCKNNNLTHGFSRTRFHYIWGSMKARCLNPKDNSYPSYGGRGVTIDSEWLSFEKFKEDMHDEYLRKNSPEVKMANDIRRIRNDVTRIKNKLFKGTV